MVYLLYYGEKLPYRTGCSRIGRPGPPVAVMLNNIKQGCPQSGIANAGVVYEAPVEGDITRLMGIFEDYKDLERIGSVRSCRDYYIFYANEFEQFMHIMDSLLLHFHILNSI